MAQRPSIKQPRPLTSTPAAAGRLPADVQSLAAAQMLGGLEAEVSPEAAPLWNFVLSHARALACGVLGVILIIVAAGAWKWYEESSADKARLELGRISATQDPAARLAALEAFAADAPASVLTAARLELAATAARAENWEKAVAAYAAVADAEKSSPLGVSARLNEADILMRLGRPAEAVSRLEAVLTAAPEDLLSTIHQQIAEAAESAGQKDRAAAAYEAALAALPPSAVSESAYYRTRIARLR